MKRPTQPINVLAGLLALCAGGSAVATHDDSFDWCRESHLEWSESLTSAPGFPGFDEATGERRWNYPHDRDADLIHLKLEISIADMAQAHLDGRETLTVAPIGRALASFRLDARAMTIRGVGAGDGRKTSFAHDDGVLTISFDPPVPMGEKCDVSIDYVVDDPPEGLIWTPPNAAFPDRTPQVHSQGQAESNSYWFPCHDFPNERLTTELIATVPAGFMVSSNGHLISHEERLLTAGRQGDGGAEQRRVEIWHWLQDKPHVAYLVSMVVGKFDVVDLGTAERPLPVYVPPGRGVDVNATYGRTPEMIAVFEKLFDEAYPWDRYAQLVVTNFGAGGMENTSATSMHDFAIIAKDDLDDHDIEGLIAHELGHQWFGDLITCNSWEHIWLNEGFATYLTGLWWENRVPRQGEGEWTGGELAYERTVIGWFDAIIKGDTKSFPETTGMCSKIYEHPGQAFHKPSDPYPKGASILHMLRRRLGDDLFFKGLRLYVDRHKLKTVETSDLREAMEEVSGESLDQFFHQWCTRPNIPRVEITSAWNADEGTLTVNGVQTQKIDGDNPAFEFDLPVLLGTEEKGNSTPPVAGVLSFRGKEATLAFKVTAQPTFVVVDPDASVLAEVRQEQSPVAWLAQARQGPSLYAKVRAIRELGKIKADDPQQRSALESLKSTSAQHSAAMLLRTESSKAALEAGGVQAALLLGSSDAWEVRLEAMDWIGGAERQWKEFKESQSRDSGAFLQAAAKSDPSLKVRAEAIRTMGRLHDPAFGPTILAALELDSHADQLRQAALEAAVQLNTPEAAGAVRKLCSDRYYNRTRAIAIDAVCKLSKHDPDSAVAAASEMLKSPIPRLKRSAAESLLEMKDARGIELLAQAIRDERSDAIRKQLERWKQQLEKDVQGAAEKK